MTTMPDSLTILEQFTLILLQQTAFEEGGGDLRSWKGYDWRVLNGLHKRGLISDPVSKAKSVFLTDEGRRQAEAFLNSYVGAPELTHAKGSLCECGCGEASPGGVFRPGHDQKLRVVLESRVGGLLALRSLVDAVESYALGRSTGEELTREVRALFGGRD
jgi:hypothetical protein